MQLWGQQLKDVKKLGGSGSDKAEEGTGKLHLPAWVSIIMARDRPAHTEHRATSEMEPKETHGEPGNRTQSQGLWREE